MHEDAARHLREAFKQTELYRSNPTNGLIGFAMQDFTHFIPGEYQAMASDFSKLTYCSAARMSRKNFLDELFEGAKTKTEKLLIREKYREATRGLWSPPLKYHQFEAPKEQIAQKMPRALYNYQDTDTLPIEEPDLFKDIAASEEDSFESHKQDMEDYAAVCKEIQESETQLQHDQQEYNSMVAREFE